LALPLEYGLSPPRFIINYYDQIFSSDPLLVEVHFTDSKGNAETVSRTIDFAGAVAKRNAFLTACALKDP
jgi:hypothetical protein